MFTLVSVAAGAISASASVVNFDFDDGEADVEFFPGVVANATVNLGAHGRVQADAGLWIEVAVTDSSQTLVDGHVNDSGLGAVGAPGGNQLSAGEIMTLRFWDAPTNGNPVPIELNGVTWENFGGTAGNGDGIIVTTGVLPAITLAANTNQSTASHTYTQTAAAEAQGVGTLEFTTPVELSTLILTDDSAGQGGSRLNQLEFNQAVVEPDPDAPNVIYIIVDDLGYSDLGCFGAEIETPNIDGLASEGLRFRQHYTYAKCETTRTALMSGMFHHKAGLGVRGGARTLGEVLQSGGYRTYLTGKWHLLGNPVDRGFHGFYGLLEGSSSHFDPFSQGKIYRDHTQLTPGDRPADFYSSDYFASEAINYIQQSVQNHPDRPFFVYLAFTAPHSPLQAPSNLVAKYRNSYGTKGWDQIREERVQRQRQLGILPEAWTASIKNEDIPGWDGLSSTLQDAEDFRMAAYAAMVERIDYNVGLVLDAIGPAGLNVADDTLIYFVSDNGSSPYPRTSNPSVPPDNPNSQWRLGPAWAWVGNTPFRYYKQNQFNGGVMTPMIVRWPAKIPNPGEIIDTPTHVMDVMATLADVANIDYSTNFPAAPTLDGVSIRPLLEGNPLPSRPVIGFEFGGKDFGFLDYPWKLSSYRREPWQLFNLETDRCETRNLARDNVAKVEQLAAEFLTWIDARNDVTGGNPTLFSGIEPATSSYPGREERYEDPLINAAWSLIPPAWTQNAVGNVTVFDAVEEPSTGLIAATLDGQRIGQTSDDFGFLHRPFLGDSELVVKVVSFTNCAPNARAGVMIRESLDTNAAFVMAEVNDNGASDPTVNLRYRAASGSNTTLIASGVVASLPIWVRLERVGHDFIASYSTNGRHYTTFVTQTVNLASLARGGIALNSQLAAGTSTGTIKVTDFEGEDRMAYGGRDLDGNGYGELAEFALGLDYGGTDDRVLNIAMVQNGGGMEPELSHARRIDPSGLEYQLLDAMTLGNFIAHTNDWTQVGTPTPFPDGLTERVRFRIAGPHPPTRFFQLAVGAVP